MLATICVSFVGCVTNPRKIPRRGLKQPLVLRLVTVQGVLYLFLIDSILSGLDNRERMNG